MFMYPITDMQDRYLFTIIKWSKYILRFGFSSFQSFFNNNKKTVENGHSFMLNLILNLQQ